MTNPETQKPSEFIEKRANELVGSGERAYHIHGYLAAIIQYLDEQWEKQNGK